MDVFGLTIYVEWKYRFKDIRGLCSNDRERMMDVFGLNIDDDCRFLI